MSGPIPTCALGSGCFSHLLSTWLCSACASHGVSYIDNFNLFWEHRQLFRIDGIHPNWLGAKLLSGKYFSCCRLLTCYTNLQSKQFPDVQALRPIPLLSVSRGPRTSPLCVLSANQIKPGPSGKPTFPVNPRISICTCHNSITSPGLQSGLISVSCAPSSSPQSSSISTIPVIYIYRPLCTRRPQGRTNPFLIGHLQWATANLPATLSATHINVGLLKARSLGINNS